MHRHYIWGTKPEPPGHSSTQQWKSTSPRNPNPSQPALASGPASPTNGRTPASGKLQPCSLQTQLTHQQAATSHGTSWASALPIRRPTQASGHIRPHNHLCQEPDTPTNSLTLALGPLGPAVRTQDLALPASGLALAAGPSFTDQ